MYLNVLALAGLVADRAARFASRLAARLAFAAGGIAAVIDGGFSDNLDMSHNNLRISFVPLYRTRAEKSSDYEYNLSAFSYVHGDYAAYHSRNHAEYAIVEQRQPELELRIEQRKHNK